MNKFLISNKLGLSLVEVVIAIGVLGIISMGTMQMLGTTSKMSSEFEKTSNILNLEKSIASYVLSKNGCMQFNGTTMAEANGTPKKEFAIRKAIRRVQGDKVILDFTDESGREVFAYKEGDIFNNVEITSMRIDSLQTLNNNNDTGILVLDLIFSLRDRENDFTVNSQTYNKKIYVPVGLSDQGGVMTITDCEIAKTEMYDNIVETLCRDVFFADTTLPVAPAGATCAQIILFVENEIKKSICTEVTGLATSFDTPTGFCNFKNAYYNKICPGNEHVVGIKSDGTLDCKVPQ